jgi:hypothetical protein
MRQESLDQASTGKAGHSRNGKSLFERILRSTVRHFIQRDTDVSGECVENAINRLGTFIAGVDDEARNEMILQRNEWGQLA